MADETTNTTNREAKTRGTLSEIAIRQKVAANAEEIVEKMLAIMRGRNENAALGATKALLNKIVPDLRSTELKGENGEPIKFNILAPASYLSALGKSITASTAGTTYGQSKVQGTDLAQKSEENNNSDKPVSSVESA